MDNNFEYSQTSLRDVEELGHTCGVVAAIAAFAAGVAYLIANCK